MFGAFLFIAPSKVKNVEFDNTNWSREIALTQRWLLID